MLMFVDMGGGGVNEKITDFGHHSSFIYYIIMKGAEGGGEG